jgi:hypothetical protein
VEYPKRNKNVKWPFYSFSLPHNVYWLTRWKEDFKGWTDMVVAYMIFGARIFTHDFIDRPNTSRTNILFFPNQIGNSNCVWTFAPFLSVSCLISWLCDKELQMYFMKYPCGMWGWVSCSSTDKHLEKKNQTPLTCLCDLKWSNFLPAYTDDFDTQNCCENRRKYFRGSVSNRSPMSCNVSSGRTLHVWCRFLFKNGPLFRFFPCDALLFSKEMKPQKIKF